MKAFIDNEEKHRFELLIDGYTAYLTYEMVNPQLANLSHTEVPVPLRNRGLGSELVQLSLEEMEKRRWKVIPTCPFISDYIRKHSEKANLVENTDFY